MAALCQAPQAHFLPNFSGHTSLTLGNTVTGPQNNGAVALRAAEDAAGGDPRVPSPDCCHPPSLPPIAEHCNPSQHRRHKARCQTRFLTVGRGRAGHDISQQQLLPQTGEERGERQGLPRQHSTRTLKAVKGQNKP